jgi:hypothetical protein
MIRRGNGIAKLADVNWRAQLLPSIHRCANTGANCCLYDPKTIDRPRKGKMCHAAGRSDSLDLVD